MSFLKLSELSLSWVLNVTEILESLISKEHEPETDCVDFFQKEYITQMVSSNKPMLFGLYRGVPLYNIEKIFVYLKAV